MKKERVSNVSEVFQNGFGNIWEAEIHIWEVPECFLLTIKFGNMK